MKVKLCPAIQKNDENNVQEEPILETYKLKRAILKREGVLGTHSPFLNVSNIGFSPSFQNFGNNFISSPNGITT